MWSTALMQGFHPVLINPWVVSPPSQTLPSISSYAEGVYPSSKVVIPKIWFNDSSGAFPRYIRAVSNSDVI